MAILAEALILYLVLFLPGAASDPAATETAVTSVPFHTAASLSRLLFYSIPAFALVWRLLLIRRPLAVWNVARPTKADGRAFIIGLPSLLIIGITVAHILPVSDLPELLPPNNTAGWAVLALSALGTGYLEESFFRFYLLNLLGDAGIGPQQRLFLSVLLFSFCHIYEGPAGAINALLAGILLALLYLRTRALHGIAFAHAAYNVFAYIL